VWKKLLALGTTVTGFWWIQELGLHILADSSGGAYQSLNFLMGLKSHYQRENIAARNCCLMIGGGNQ